MTGKHMPPRPRRAILHRSQNSNAIARHAARDRNHRRAAHATPERRRRCSTVETVPLDHELPHYTSRTAREPAIGAGARREARLPQRPGHRDRADRHDRSGDGLRHHRRRARLRAGEVQEAGRRRLLQDHQPRSPRGAAHARLHRGRSRSTPSAMAAWRRRRPSTRPR